MTFAYFLHRSMVSASNPSPIILSLGSTPGDRPVADALALQREHLPSLVGPPLRSQRNRNVMELMLKSCCRRTSRFLVASVYILQQHRAHGQSRDSSTMPGCCCNCQCWSWTTALIHHRIKFICHTREYRASLPWKLMPTPEDRVNFNATSCV